MAYLGRPGATAPLTSADIPDNSITAAKIVADTIAAGDIATGAVGSSEIAADAVGTAELANDVDINTSGTITTTGAFTSVGIDDNATANAITIDANENVGIGFPNAEDYTSLTGLFDITSQGNPRASIIAFSDNSSEKGRIRFTKSHTDTVGDFISTVDDEELGSIEWYGINGSNTHTTGGSIRMVQDGEVDNRTPCKLVFATGESTAAAGSNVDRMIIDRSGNVGIGGTPYNKLDVRGSSVPENSTNYKEQRLLRLYCPAGTEQAQEVDFWVGRWTDSSASTRARTAMVISLNHELTSHTTATADVDVLTMISSGTISGDFNDTSDRAKKENIKTLTSGLAEVLALNPVSFDWKLEGAGSKTGFIAQEVEEITSFANDVIGEEGNKAINITGLVAHAVKAIQELSAKNDALEAKVTALENA